MSSQLPDFATPPVVEVALATQFASPILDPLVLGSYWAQIREEFPLREEQPPLALMHEDFGVPALGDPIRVELLNRPPMPRYWFKSSDQSELIQVQHDWFALNWRKMPGAEDYPRYPKLRERLEVRLRQFLATLDADVATTAPDWCEVTYVNHIEPEVGTQVRPDPSRVLKVFQAPDAKFPPMPEDTQFAQRFLIPDPRNPENPLGRLNVSLTSAFRVADMSPIYVLTLTARGRALSGDVDGALAFLDLGREWIVRSFEGLTTENMHESWQIRR